jgi:hypothetical protein
MPMLGETSEVCVSPNKNESDDAIALVQLLTESFEI